MNLLGGAFGIESLQKYADKTMPDMNPVVELRDNQYVLFLDGDIEFESQRFEDIVAHIDMICLYYSL